MTTNIHNYKAKDIRKKHLQKKYIQKTIQPKTFDINYQENLELYLYFILS